MADSTDKLTGKKILHKRSNVVTDGSPKLPTVDQLEYGELAINYADGNETLSIKNSKNEIVSFDMNLKDKVLEDEKVIAAAFCAIKDGVGLDEYGNVNVNNSAFRYGVNTISTLTNLPIDKRLVVATISESETLSIDLDSYNALFTTFPSGIGVRVIVKNESTTDSITVTLPTSTDDVTYTSNATTITVSKSSYEIIDIDFISATDIFITKVVKTTSSTGLVINPGEIGSVT